MIFLRIKTDSFLKRDFNPSIQDGGEHKSCETHMQRRWTFLCNRSYQLIYVAVGMDLRSQAARDEKFNLAPVGYESLCFLLAARRFIWSLTALSVILIPNGSNTNLWGKS